MSLKSPTVARPWSITRRLLLPLAMVATMGLTACGADVNDAESAGTGGDAFPVSIDHKYGTTKITSKPKNVVALGLNDADTLLALGVKPVGVVDWFGERPYGKWPWAADLWEGNEPEIVGERDDYNMEEIAALGPDLIVAQYSGMSKDQYETLSKWAPVVAQPLDYQDYAAPWQKMAEPIAEAVGESGKLQDLVTGIEDRFAKVREEHPEFAEQVVSVADSAKPGSYVAFAADDPKMEFMIDLGFKPDPNLTDLVEKGSNVAKFSSERLDLLDVDRLIWLIWDEAVDKQVKNEPLYPELDVVKDGRDLFIPYNEPPVGAAISFNTVLSIPYAIDQMVPLLTGEK